MEGITFKSLAVLYKPGLVVEGSAVLRFSGGHTKRFALLRKTDTEKGKDGYDVLWHPTGGESSDLADDLIHLEEKELEKFLQKLKEKYDVKGRLILCKDDWYDESYSDSYADRIQAKLNMYLKIHKN